MGEGRRGRWRGERKEEEGLVGGYEYVVMTKIIVSLNGITVMDEIIVAVLASFLDPWV